MSNFTQLLAKLATVSNTDEAGDTVETEDGAPGANTCTKYNDFGLDGTVDSDGNVHICGTLKLDFVCQKFATIAGNVKAWDRCKKEFLVTTENLCEPGDGSDAPENWEDNNPGGEGENKDDIGHPVVP
jgi:hypothetical protein